MAPCSERFRWPSGDRPAAPWALLWLGVIAAGAWAPLLLLDKGPHAEIRPQAAEFRGALIPHSSPFTGPPLPAAANPLLRSPVVHGSLIPSGPSLVTGEEPLRQPRAWARMEVPERTALLPGDPTPVVRPAITGAVLLGGPLGLESLEEKPMVPAARLEQTLRARATDRLEAVPSPWRPTMRALLKGSTQVQPAEVVRLPAPHLKTPEEYPLVMKADGIAETTVTPPPRSKETMERWAQKLSLPPPGSTRPMLVVLEPIPAEEPTAAPPSTSTSSQPETENPQR